jgi:hypothetical protein
MPSTKKWLAAAAAGVALGGASATAGAAVRGGIVNPPSATTPDAPSAVSASPGVGDASISFTAPDDNGSTISGYTVTASPGGETGTGDASPITVSGLTPGTAYTFTVVATNGVGPGPASTATSPVAAEYAPQTLGKLTVSFVSFTAATHGGPTTRQAATGTQLSYSDSAALTSTITIARVTSGVMRGGSCVAASASAHGKHCTLTVAVGSFTHVDVVGVNHVHFSGRIAGHALAGGLFQFQVNATDAGVVEPLRRLNFDVF